MVRDQTLTGTVVMMATDDGTLKQDKKEKVKARREANKEVLRAKKHAYYLVNKNRFNAKSRAAYAANKEERKRQNKKLYEKNKSRYLAQQKKQYEANREKILAKNRERYARNKDRYQAHQKAYREADPEKVRALRKKRDGANRDRILEEKRCYHEQHRDEDNARSKVNYERNKDRINSEQRKHYKDNREEILAVNREWRKNNPDKTKAQSKKYYAKNKDKLSKTNSEAHRRRKMMCIEHYSGGTNACECCGESHTEFLAIDHIEGGGREHKRRERITGMHEYLVGHGFPDGYRILCHNCNMAVGHGGTCPHKGVSDEHISFSMASTRKRRRRILEHYSEGEARCSCCGETEYKFLSLDHINDDGHVFQGTASHAKNLYYWVERHGYPPILQVLCHNCNACKKNYGTCPHTRREPRDPGKHR